MRASIRALTLPMLACTALTSCVIGKDASPQALSAPQWSMQESFMLNNPPPPELRYVSLPPQASPAPSLVPRADEWAQWQTAPAKQVCTGRGRQRKCRQGTRSIVEQANSLAVVKPTASVMAGGHSAMVRYDFDWRVQKIYEVHIGVISPTLIELPPGERLAVSMPVNSQYWATKEVEMGHGEERTEAVVIRAEYPDEEANTFLLFQSGLKIMLKLIATANSGMLGVAWNVPQRTVKPPELSVEQRPPTIDTSRLHEAYQVEPPKKGSVPPWMPVGAFDDGHRTYINLPDITGTRAPVAFGIDQKGKTALVQSRLYTHMDRPEEGTWLVVNDLWPAIELKDSAGVRIKLIRHPPQPLTAQGSSHVH